MLGVEAVPGQEDEDGGGTLRLEDDFVVAGLDVDGMLGAPRSGGRLRPDSGGIEVGQALRGPVPRAGRVIGLVDAVEGGPAGPGLRPLAGGVGEGEVVAIGVAVPGGP